MAEYFPLYMARENLEHVVVPEMPTGISFTNMDPDNLLPWYTLQRLSEPHLTIHDGLLEQQLVDIAALSGRGFYLKQFDEIIGTGIAWWNTDNQGQRWGQLRWVAVHPSWRGLGLGHLLVSRLLVEVSNTDTRCFLETSAERLAAIRLYRGLGFQPRAESPRGKALWQQVMQRLADDDEQSREFR